MAIGKGAIGKFAITEATGAGVIAAVLTIAGAGVFTPVLNSFPAAVFASAGSGVTSFVLHSFAASVLSSAGSGVATIVLHSFDGAVFACAGTSTSNFPGSRIDNRVLAIAGASDFETYSYAFFIDAERACVHEETRTVSVSFENRTAIIAPEGRVYEVDIEQRGLSTPNRKRIC